MYQKTEHDFRIKLLSGNNVVLVECSPYDSEIFIPKIINGHIVFENIIRDRQNQQTPMDNFHKIADLTKIQNSPYATARDICTMKREPPDIEKLQRCPIRTDHQNTMPLRRLSSGSVRNNSRTSFLAKTKFAKSGINFKKSSTQYPVLNRQSNYTTHSVQRKDNKLEKMLTSERRKLTQKSPLKSNNKKKKASKKNLIPVEFK